MFQTRHNVACCADTNNGNLSVAAKPICPELILTIRRGIHIGLNAVEMLMLERVGTSNPQLL